MSYLFSTLRKLPLTLCLGLAVIFPSFAQDQNDSFTWQFDLGAAVQHRTNIVDSLDGNDGEISGTVLLAGGVYYDKFFIESSPFSSRPLTLGYTLSETRSTMINIIGTSWFAEISEEAQNQGNRLDGIKSRHSSYEVGIEYLKQFRNSDVRIRMMHDVLNQHQGFFLSLDQSLPIYKTNWLIIPSWGVNYLSEKAVQYYYGVSESEVMPNRPFYSPDAGWSLTGRLYVERPLNKKWTLFGFASYSHFSSSISDSPITSIDNGTHTIALGVLWSF